MHTLASLSRIIACCAFGLLAAMAVRAAPPEDATKLLKGKAVTESNVLDALTPPATPGDGDVDTSVRTRGLRVTPTGKSSVQTGAATRNKASASLLITFETNSANLTTRSKEQLDVVAAALRNERLKAFSFEVEGHADSRGTADSNMTLSQQRAESVRSYLVTSQGIPESRLRAVGKGDSEPMNARDVAAAENRRVTITTLTP